MELRPKRWGNSLAIRLPMDIVRQLSLDEKTPLTLEVVEGGLFFKRQRRTRSLDELLEGVSPETVHHDIDWGEPQGAEVW